MDLIRILSDQRAELEHLDLSRIVPRPQERELNLESHRAQVVIGVRRCGKSTLCQKKLIDSHIPFGYVNFDDENFRNLSPQSLNEIIETLYRLQGPLDTFFFDEIQNVEVWPLFVNRLLRQGKKLIITGSNANLLSGELATHLTGRYHQITLYPFSFKEELIAKGIDTEGLDTMSEALRMRALDHYLFSGGFPEVVEDEEPEEYARELIETIILKDILQRYRLHAPQSLRLTANAILDRAGQIMQTSTFASELEFNSKTLGKYLQYLCNAYLLREVPLLSTKNLDRQRSKKFYAVDNAFLSNHDYSFGSPGYGWRLENTVAIELFRRYHSASEQVYFMRKPQYYEVDFAVVSQFKVQKLIEVTYDFREPTSKLYNREIGALVKGAHDTGCRDLTLIVMEGNQRVENVDGLDINIVKAVDWLIK